MKLNIYGINWSQWEGYGRLFNGYSRSLIRAGHTIYPMDKHDLYIGDSPRPAWSLQARGVRFDHATLQYGYPNGMEKLPGRSIGYTMYECLRIPSGWVADLHKTCQHLIVPSPGLVAVFQDAGLKIPIAAVPGGIDPDECPIKTRPSNGPFTFGCLADRGDRKAWQKVVAAFYRAFQHDDKNVRLLIKSRPGAVRNLDFSYSNDDRLSVWQADVERVADVWTHFDAFIFPSRGEGYGMPPREAAACGIPTVVQRFLGTADHCDEWAIPLERFRLADSGMESRGQWAEPNLDELVDVMRDIYANRDAYKQRALKAAQWLRDNETYDHAAVKLVDTLSGWIGGNGIAVMPYVPKASANGHKELIHA